MPKKKVIDRATTAGPKDSWQLYGLQMLTPNKFVTVVGKILEGKYALVNARNIEQGMA